MKLSDGEKLILTMLCEIHAHLKVQDGVDAKFILAALHGGHLAAVKDKYVGIFDIPEAPEQVVHEVNDILFMWQLLESNYEAFPPDEKERVRREAKVVDEQVRFPGFDGNNEGEHYGTAGFVLDHLGNFERFKGRNLNSHAPMLGTYRRMLPVFRATKFNQGRMTVEHVIAVLKSQRA